MNETLLITILFLFYLIKSFNATSYRMVFYSFAAHTENQRAPYVPKGFFNNSPGERSPKDFCLSPEKKADGYGEAFLIPYL